MTTTISVTLTDDQARELIYLASDLRKFFAARREGIFKSRIRGKQRNPHRFSDSDSWIDVASWIDRTVIPSREAFDLVAGGQDGKFSAHAARRLAAAMRACGWQGPKLIRLNGQMVRGYSRDPK